MEPIEEFLKRITVNAHSSVRIEAAGKVVYVDPFMLQTRPQDADVVFLLRRPSRNANDPESQDQTLAYVDIAKNRNGETGEVKMNFIREWTRFLDREPERTATENFQSSEPEPQQGEFTPDPNA